MGFENVYDEYLLWASLYSKLLRIPVSFQASLVCVQNCNSCIRSAKRGHLDSTLRRIQNLICNNFWPLNLECVN
jgi:hypothetical protein